MQVHGPVSRLPMPAIQPGKSTRLVRFDVEDENGAGVARVSGMLIKDERI